MDSGLAPKMARRGMTADRFAPRGALRHCERSEAIQKPRVKAGLLRRKGSSQGRGYLRHRDAGAHQADAVEVGLLAGAFLGAFAGLVAFIQELDLLQFVERLAERASRVLELDAQ